MWVRMTAIDCSFFMPMTESRAPVIPTSVMYAVPPARTQASAVATCVWVPTTTGDASVDVTGERDLLARRLRVDVDEHDRARDLELPGVDRHERWRGGMKWTSPSG